MLSRLSIRQKLTAMLMLISGAVLVLASIAFVAWDFYRFRADMQADLVTQARLVLDNTAAAVTFNDPDGGRRNAGDAGNSSAYAARLLVPARRRRCSPSACFRDHGRPLSGGAAARVRCRPNRMFVTEQLARGRDPAPRAADRGRSRRPSRPAADAEPPPSPRSSSPGMLLSLLLSHVLQRHGGRADCRASPTTARTIADRGDYSIRAARARPATRSACWCRRSTACSTKSRPRSASAPSCSIASSKPIA